MTSMLFGREFIGARIHARKRQGDIARLAQVDPSYLASIEIGRRRAPGQLVITKLILALDPSETKKQRLQRFAIIDRMLDAAEKQRDGKMPMTDIEDLVRQVATFSEKEWRFLNSVIGGLVQQRSEQLEEFE